MIYVGIVGALSPLGQEVINFLKTETDSYRIVFYVDAGYRVSSPMNATYASVEAALSFNQVPSVVIDCDDPATAIDRAKIYRFYTAAAIMCCSAMPEDLDNLSRSYVLENQQAQSLLVTPDYRVGPVCLMEFFLFIADKHRDDVDRIEINVAMSPHNKIDLTRWLYFGRLLNDKLGLYDAKYSVHGNVCNFGDVIIKAISDKKLGNEAEDIHVNMYYGKKDHLCNTYMKTSVKNNVQDSVNGIVLMLKWFAAHPEEIAEGKVLTNHLSTVICEKKKNLL